MSDLVHVSLMVGEDTREEWRQAAEDSEEYQSMSQLIRTAVGKELSGQFEGGGLDRADLQEELDGRIGQDLETVKGVLERVERQIKQSSVGERTHIGRWTKLEAYSAFPKGKDNALTFEEIAERLGDPFTPTDISVLTGEIDGIEVDRSTQPPRYYREE